MDRSKKTELQKKKKKKNETTPEVRESIGVLREANEKQVGRRF
jgi:hypothetical protein